MNVIPLCELNIALHILLHFYFSPHAAEEWWGQWRCVWIITMIMVIFNDGGGSLYLVVGGFAMGTQHGFHFFMWLKAFAWNLHCWFFTARSGDNGTENGGHVRDAQQTTVSMDNKSNDVRTGCDVGHENGEAIKSRWRLITGWRRLSYLGVSRALISCFISDPL